MQGTAFVDDKKSQPAWLHSGRLGKNKDYDEQQKNDLMLGLAAELDVEIDVLEPLLHVEARAGLLDPWQVSVAYDLGIGIVDGQVLQKAYQGSLLGWGAGVGRIAVLVQAALIADADAVGIVMLGMGAHLILWAAWIDDAILRDVEVIADALETTSFVACLQGLYGEVLRYFCGRTVDDDQIDFTHGFLMNYGVRREFLMIGSSVRKTRWRWR